MRPHFKLGLRKAAAVQIHMHRGTWEVTLVLPPKCKNLDNVPISGNTDGILYQLHLRLPSRIVLNLIMKDYKRDDV